MSFCAFNFQLASIRVQFTHAPSRVIPTPELKQILFSPVLAGGPCSVGLKGPGWTGLRSEGSCCISPGIPVSDPLPAPLLPPEIPSTGQNSGSAPSSCSVTSPLDLHLHKRSWAFFPLAVPSPAIPGRQSEVLPTPGLQHTPAFSVCAGFPCPSVRAGGGQRAQTVAAQLPVSSAVRRLRWSR